MSKTPQAKLETDPLLATAVEWFVELRRPNVTSERVAAWQSWLAAAEAHREAFAHIERLWALPRHLHAVPWPTDAEVAGDTYDGTESVSNWRADVLQGVSPQVRERRWARSKWSLARALAASLAALLITVLSWSGYKTWPEWSARLRASEPLVIETTAGVRRLITLSDGSAINASGRTRLSATMANDARIVILEHGEAFFEVTKDSSRPFTVKAGDTAITAVGTAFNVRRARERVVVAVAEGRVRVEAPTPHGSAVEPRSAYTIRMAQLDAGQQLALEPNDVNPRIATIDIGSVGGWREGRLQYLNEPLEIVIADLARYSAREIHITDAKVGTLRVTGTVFEQDVEGWLESLEATFPVQVTRGSDGAIQLDTR